MKNLLFVSLFVVLTSSISAQPRCFSELSYIVKTRLITLQSSNDLMMDICNSTSTGVDLMTLANDAITMLFTDGVIIPSACNAALMSDDVVCDSNGTPKGGKGTPKSGKSKSKNTPGKKRGRGNSVIEFDVEISCGSNPCIKEGLTTDESAATFYMLVTNFTSMFTSLTSPRSARTMTISLLNGVLFYARVERFRKVSLSCSGEVQSEYTPKRRRGKSRSRKREKQLNQYFCGKFI